MRPRPAAAEWRIGPTELIFLLATIQSLQTLAINVMLPALGLMAHDLDIRDANDRQLVVSIFLICSGIGALFPGALADRFGRRPVLLACLGSYVLFSLASALVSDFAAMLVLRGCAGIVSAGLLVTSVAVIRDRYVGYRMASMQSLISMVLMTAPIVAPTLGQGILAIASWRWTFGVVAVAAAIAFAWVYLRLDETLDREHRQPIHPVVMLRNMHAVFATRSATGYLVGLAVIHGSLMGFIISSQQLMAEHFALGDRFPLVFGAMAVGLAASSLVNARIVARFGTRRVSHLAVMLFILVGLAQVVLAWGGNQTVWQFVPLMAASLCLMGFIGTNFGAIALEPFPRTAGAAASVQTAVRLIGSSLIGALIGQAYDGSARPLAIGLEAAGIVSLLLVLYSERGRLLHRQHE